jgi:hypothetical protein
LRALFASKLGAYNVTINNSRPPSTPLRPMALTILNSQLQYRARIRAYA